MPPATRYAFGEEIVKLGAGRDFMVINADTKACRLEEFKHSYPEREFSVGIAEQNMMTMAAGMASCGDKVFVSTFAVFASMRACEQVRTFICYPKLNVTIAATHTGLQVGEDGATHAAVEDIAIMSALPNMTVIQPSDEISARAAARFAVDFEGPLYVRLHRNPVETIHRPDYVFDPLKPELLCDYGNDAAILVTGIMAKKCMEAAEFLKNEGIFVRVLELPGIKPLPESVILEEAVRCGAVVTVEDHNVIGGFGSAVAALIAQNCPVPMGIVGIRDRFGESGDPELLYRDNGMSAPQIAQRVRDILPMKK